MLGVAQLGGLMLKKQNINNIYIVTNGVNYLSFSNWNSDGHSPYVFTNSASASANSCIIGSSYSSIALEIKFRLALKEKAFILATHWVLNVNRFRIEC